MNEDPRQIHGGPGAWLYRRVSQRTAGMTIAIIGLFTLGGMLGWFIVLERSVDRFQREGLEWLPNSAVHSWGFPLESLRVDPEWIWSMPGGLRKDDIPVLTLPDIASPEDYPFYVDAPVIGVRRGHAARAYPLEYLFWHQCVNDELGGEPILVLYHAVNGTVMVFSRRTGDRTFEFGASGMFLLANPVLYDRQPRPQQESLWSPLLMQAIAGPAADAGLRLELIDADLTSWENWFERYPHSTLMTRRTGYENSSGGEGYLGPRLKAFERPLVPHRPRSPEEAREESEEDDHDEDESERTPPWWDPRVVVVGPSDMRAYPFTEVEDSGTVSDRIDGVDFSLALSDGVTTGILMHAGPDMFDPPPVNRFYTFRYVWEALEEFESEQAREAAAR